MLLTPIPRNLNSCHAQLINSDPTFHVAQLKPVSAIPSYVSVQAWSSFPAPSSQLWSLCTITTPPSVHTCLPSACSIRTPALHPLHTRLLSHLCDIHTGQSYFIETSPHVNCFPQDLHSSASSANLPTTSKPWQDTSSLQRVRPATLHHRAPPVASGPHSPPPFSHPYSQLQ